MWEERRLERYERQLALIGKKGQGMLKQAKVFIAGAGGLGTAAAAYLAAAGIGVIRLIDSDEVGWSNLNRQILYSEADLGKKKAPTLIKKLQTLNPLVRLEAEERALTPENVEEWVSGFDALVDALDNFSSRYCLNRASLLQGIPLIHGAVRGFFGQVTTLVPGKTACLRCLFPEPPKDESVPVVGAVSGFIGCFQALEVVKSILGRGELLLNRLLIFDGLAGTLDEIQVRRREDCPECGEQRNEEDED